MATNQPIKLQPRPNVKQVGYLAKTFSDFRQNFIEFAKAYYPNTYADFNETSPGMMFIEMASYLGDVLSFYIDNSFKENLLAYAEDQKNIITIAQFLGYKPKIVAPASTTAEISILVPATEKDNMWVPDEKYLLYISAGSIFSTNDGRAIKFRLAEDVDFKDIAPDCYIVNTRVSGRPATFIVTKQCRLIAGVEKSIDVGFGTAKKFTSIILPDENIVGISDVVDSNGSKWYEVDFLAQDVIMDEVVIADNGEVGQLPSSGLRLKKVPKRFVKRINRDMKTELYFGSGVMNDAEEEVYLDSRQVANSQYGTNLLDTVGNVSLNNVNFLNNSAFGLAPANVSLTIKYVVGGGVESNTASNTITNIESLIVQNDITAYTQAEVGVFNATIQTAQIVNRIPATGGGEGESIEEIRENALAYFNAQNRVVTTEDYVMRSYALPSKYGRVAKAYTVRDEQLNSILTYTDPRFVNQSIKPTSVNLYVLGYNKDAKLTTLNTITKNNLARYLNQYRMLTDDINILDAFIINVGVKFDITVFRNYNVKDVLTRAIGVMQDYFSIDKWTINQPIIISDIYYQLGSVEGVQTVTNVEIFNKYLAQNGLDYQNYRYDIAQATINGVVYPSLDPSIFEVRYPQTDIIGSATQ